MTTTTTPPPSTPLPKGEGAIGSKLPGRAHETCAYLDYNATTPIYPEVAAAMEPFLWEHFGNPSSGHAFAAPCRDAIATARNRVATVLGCAPDEIVFTSCGSESDNHAIASAVEHARRSAGGARRTRPARRHDGGGAPGDIRCVLHTGPHTTALAW